MGFVCFICCGFFSVLPGLKFYTGVLRDGFLRACLLPLRMSVGRVLGSLVLVCAWFLYGLLSEYATSWL